MPSPSFADRRRFEQRALVVGAVAGALCVVGVILNKEEFYYAYLIAFVFWLGITLGSLGLLMIQHLSGGAWGFVIRRQLEAVTRLLPLMAVLVLPVLFGIRTLYPWARPELVNADVILQSKRIYLNETFFVARTFIYFAVWIALARFLNRWSLEQDERGEEPAGHRMRALSGGGLLLYIVTMTFASIDWIMSLEPHWFSTIFSVIIIGGQGLSALAVAIIVLAALANEKPLAEVAAPVRFHDLGNLLLAFLMLWAYFSFSQFLIIWSGNLPEEIPWYVHRTQNSWQWISIALVIFHFAVPFLLLLSRTTKRVSRTLVKVAAGILVMRMVELFWIIAPERSPDGFHLHWLDLVAPIAIGGVWISFFVRALGNRALLPRYGDEGAYAVHAHAVADH
jgi:hypothetical protein